MVNKGELRGLIQHARDLKGWAEGENGFFKLLSVIESDIYEEILSSSVEDVEVRDKLFLMIRLLREIHTRMHNVIVGGANAEVELQHLIKVDQGRIKEFH